MRSSLPHQWSSLKGSLILSRNNNFIRREKHPPIIFRGFYLYKSDIAAKSPQTAGAKNGPFSKRGYL